MPGYQSAAGDLADVSAARSAAERLLEKLESLQFGLANGSVAAETANPVIRKLARLLVPLGHTVVPRFRHDSALPVPLAPAVATKLNDHGPETLVFAQLAKRACNRVAAAPRDAEHLVASAL